jgi:3-oxoacyl-[acyl-carrier protein] reductase
MDIGLKGKVALVTGAGSQKGFGKGIAEVLADEGCDIAVCDMDIQGAEQTAAEISKKGVRAIAVKADITNGIEVKEMVKKVQDELGRIDILVNNAGGSVPPMNFVDTTEERWARDINLNLIGTTIVTRAVLPQMIERKSGAIISISSIASTMGTAGGTAYAAAKAAINNFTRSLAQELARDGISVNCIAPSLGKTAFYDEFPKDFTENFMNRAVEAGRYVTPEEIGNVVAFLASESTNRIMGQCIQVTG